MPSTYSPLLRLELIGSGEQAGLWGETTNKNLGTLLEQAIAGVTSISLSGGAGVVALTTLNGTQDQARSAVLYFIGNPSGEKVIEIPAVEKLYVARNDTSTNQKIVFRTPAQVANPLLGGVELLAGEATLVFCDGQFARAGIQTADVGTLTVAGGGTGQTSFTAGFIKSPGGTGGLTSSATVNLATDVSGTLQVAAGGTGKTSLGAGSVLLGNGTSGVVDLTGNVIGQVLTWNGSAWQASSPTVVGVTSFNGRTGSVTPAVADYSSFYPSLSTAYSNPTWISSLAGSKITGTVPAANTATTAGTATTATSANFASSAGSVPWSGITSKPTTLSGFGITDGVTLGTSQTISGPKNFTGGIQSQAYNFSATTSWYFFQNRIECAVLGATGRMLIDSGGNVTITGTLFQNSDRRLKDDIQDYQNGLDVLNQLKIREWTFNGKGGTQAGKRGVGVIADEIENLLPDTVMETEQKLNPGDEDLTEIKNVSNSEVIWLAVKAIQELSAKVTALEAELAAK